MFIYMVSGCPHMGLLTFVGLGLYSERDITLAGLEAARSCDTCFAEFYTSALGVSLEEVEKMLGRAVVPLSREEVEEGSVILGGAERESVCLLTGGDPMTATTHVDLRLRAVERGIATRVIHGVSISTAAAGLLGLQSYKFGRATTLVTPQENYFPTSPYEVIRDNKQRGLHTLVLLDIHQHAARYMTANQGIDVLLEMERRMSQEVIMDKTLLAVVARASSPSPVVKAGYPPELRRGDFGPPLHTLVVPGHLHPMEARALVLLAGAPSELLG